MSLRQAGWVRISAAAFVYLLAGWLSLSSPSGSPLTKGVWLTAGVGLAAFLICGNRVWPAIALARALLAWQAYPHAGFVAAVVIADTGESFLAATLLRRLGFRPSLERLRDALFFLLFGVALAPAASGAVAEALISLTDLQSWSRFYAEWFTWWRANAVGVLVVAPLLLVWRERSAIRLDARQWREAGLLTLTTAATHFVAFLTSAATTVSHPGLAIIPAYWAALRFGQRGSTLATAVVTATSSWGVLHRTGTFHWNSSLNTAFLDQWFFLMAVGASMLPLAAALAEMSKTEQTRRRLAETLENTSDFVGMCDRQGMTLFVNHAGRAMVGISDQEDLSRRHIRDFHPPSAADQIEQVGIPAANRDGSWKGETALLRRSGEVIPVSQVILAHKDADGGVEFFSTIMRDISGRQRMESALRAIGMAVSAGGGEAFFLTLVQKLSDALRVPYVFIGELRTDAPGKIRTLAFCSHGQIARNFEYDLEGSPCQTVVGQQICVYPAGVQKLFPKDSGLVKLAAQCYVGAPLTGSGGEALGLAVVMDEQPLHEEGIAKALLQICSARAANEIERLRVENALRQSEEKFALAFHQSPDALAITTFADGRFVEVNQSFLQMYGAAREEVIGRTVYELKLWADPGERDRLIAARAGATKLEAQELRFRRRSGEEFVALLSAGTISLGGVSCILGTYRDITERKNAEQALLRSEERYRDLFENANDIIFTTDMAGRFTSVNRKAEEISGYTRQEFLGMTLFDLVDPAQTPRARELFGASVAGLRTQMVSEFDTLTKDGQRRHLDLAARFLLQDGRPVGFQFIARDVTERRSLEAQFRQAQKMEAIGRLAAGVAHDFNNLLTVIQGYCDLHLPDLPPQHEVRPALEAILQAGKRAAGLTQQLLAFSRQQAVQPRTLDLNAALAEMKALLVSMVGEDVTLEFHLEPELGRVRVDPGLLGQVVMNLAVNARDAMPGGGRLSIGTSNVEIDQAFAQAHFNALPGPYAMLSVTDTGIGMDDATQARIFDPFFTTKEVGKGTGLGLATVYGIVQQFKGHIWVHSEPGKGATFRIYLPRIDGAVRPLEPTPVSAATRGSGETVLLVEDDPALCSLTQQFLQTLGYRALVASNSAEAQEIAAREPGTIHLLLTDLIMPGMTGRDLADALAAGRPEMRVLFMSGYGDHHLLTGHGAIPPAAFIQKPFDLAALSAKVHGLLGGHRTAASG